MMLETLGVRSLTTLMVEQADKTRLRSVTLTADVSGAHDCISAWHPCIHCMHALESACMVYAAECMCRMSLMLLASELEQLWERQALPLTVPDSWRTGGVW
jgi:hypothetical protein